MKILVIDYTRLLAELELTYGSVGIDPKMLAVATYLYIHDVYGVEGAYFKQFIRTMPLEKEVIALDIAKSHTFIECFRGNPFPPNVYTCVGIDHCGPTYRVLLK